MFRARSKRDVSGAVYSVLISPATMLMTRLASLLLISTVFSISSSAQTQQVLFPGETGETLKANIRAAYYATSVNGTNDNLYGVVDRQSNGTTDGVFGIYTGWFVPFDCVPSCDFSQDMFNGGSGINQEHTWPQAQGASTGNANVDLHHLLPSKVSVNSDRGNLPFANITDTQATNWYRDVVSQSGAPAADRGEWSKRRSGVSFEPRDISKGNVARAMFYFLTMYGPGGTAQANTSWFAPQQRTLYDWNYADPVDQIEYDRTFRASTFQQNKPNPFVLDSTLIRRAFFPQIMTANESEATAQRLSLELVGPHPARSQTAFTVLVGEPTSVRAELFDALGRSALVVFDAPVPAGNVPLRIDTSTLPPGLYVLRVTTATDVASHRMVVAR